MHVKADLITKALKYEFGNLMRSRINTSAHELTIKYRTYLDSNSERFIALNG